MYQLIYIKNFATKQKTLSTGKEQHYTLYVKITEKRRVNVAIDELMPAVSGNAFQKVEEMKTKAKEQLDWKLRSWTSSTELRSKGISDSV